MPVHDHAELSAVEAAERRFAAVEESERLRLYRLRLQATVTAVSPLTRDITAWLGASLDEAASRLRPTIPRLSTGNYLHTVRDELIPRRGTARPHRFDLPVRDSDRRLSRRIAREGAIVPSAHGPGHRFGIVPVEGVLESAGWLGPAWFCTDGAVAHVLVEMPDTMALVSPGKLVGELVGHPALSGRDYPVRRAAALGDGMGVALTFRTGLIRHRMPWVDELAYEMERPS